jgi:DNA-binding beta-propeller fold protein YncE
MGWIDLLFHLEVASAGQWPPCSMPPVDYLNLDPGSRPSTARAYRIDSFSRAELAGEEPEAADPVGRPDGRPRHGRIRRPVCRLDAAANFGQSPEGDLDGKAGDMLRAIFCCTLLCLPSAAGAGPHRTAPPGLEIVGRIAIPDGPWDYTSIDAASRRLYLGRGDGVMALDLETGRVTARLVPGARVHAVVPVTGTGRVLSTNGESNTATLAEAATGEILAEIPTGQKPDAAIQDPKTGLVLVMDGKSGDVTLIDPASAKAVGSIAIGGALEFVAADGAGRAYVNVEDRSELAILDIAARKVIGRVALAGCDSPSGLARDSESGVLLTVCANGVALAVDPVKAAIIVTLPIGKRPDAAIFDEARHLFLVPCGGDGTLTVISSRGSVLAVAGTVETERGARTGALDPVTGRLYLPTADFGSPPGPEARPVPVPGSFHLLVLG